MWGKPWLKLNSNKDPLKDDVEDQKVLLGAHVPKFKDLLIEKALYNVGISHIALHSIFNSYHFLSLLLFSSFFS